MSMSTTTKCATELSATEFRKAFAAMKAVASNVTLSTFSYLKVVSNGKTTSIMATNGDVEIIFNWDGLTDEHICRYISVKSLCDALKMLPVKTVSIDTRGINLGGVPIPYADNSVDEWQRMEDLLALKATNPAGFLVDADVIIAASKFASTEQTRYIMNGVHFGDGAIAATDGRRLIAMPVKGMKEDFILPLKACQVLDKAASCEQFKVNCYERFARLRMVNGKVEICARRIEGGYPDWRKIIPKKTGQEYDGYETAWNFNELGIPRHQFIRFIRNYSGKSKNKPVVLKFKGATVDVAHRLEEGPDSPLGPAITVGGFYGLDMDFDVNGDLLADVIENCDHALLSEKKYSPLIGTFITNKNEEEMKCLVMPLA